MSRLLVLLFLLSLPGVQAVAADVEVVAESLQMTEARVPVTRENGELVDMSIRIGYRDGMTQADYPDFIALKKELRDWADGYDWTPVADSPPAAWETLARDISIRVIDNYPTINRAALSVVVHPNADRPYAQTFKSVAQRPDQAGEPVTTDVSLVLPIESHGLDHQGPNVVDLTTALHYARDPGAREYPPSRDILSRIFKLMADYPVESDYWETLVKSMSADLLETYPQFEAIDMDLQVYPTATVSYFHNIHVRTERE